MKLGVYLGKPNQLRAIAPIANAAGTRGWQVRWHGPGVVGAQPHPRDLPDVMLSLDPPTTPTPWIWLQAGMDPFSDPALPNTDAIVAVYTDWWLAQLPDGVRGVTVGFPLLAQQPLDPMLVYVPFSVRSGSPTRWQRYRNWRAHRQFIRDLERYVDTWHYPLRVKVRAKDPIPATLRALADEVVDDESGAGDTLDWLAGALGCIHMYSSVVLEAAALGVPSLCLDPGPGAFRAVAQRFCHGRLGGLFHWPGVVEHRRMALPWNPPVSWQIDPDALRRYRETYVGQRCEAAQNVCDLAWKMR